MWFFRFVWTYTTPKSNGWSSYFFSNGHNWGAKNSNPCSESNFGAGELLIAYHAFKFPIKNARLRKLCGARYGSVLYFGTTSLQQSTSSPLLICYMAIEHGNLVASHRIRMYGRLMLTLGVFVDGKCGSINMAYIHGSYGLDLPLKIWWVSATWEFTGE